MSGSFKKFMRKHFEPEHQFSESDVRVAYTAGLLRAAEIAEGMEDSWADLEWNQVCQDIATAIRKEAGE